MRGQRADRSVNERSDNNHAQWNSRTIRVHCSVPTHDQHKAALLQMLVRGTVKEGFQETNKAYTCSRSVDSR